MKRLVLDTNLLIAAFFNKKSASFQIIQLARKEKVKLLWTRPIKKEAKLILGNIKKSLKHQRGAPPEKFKLSMEQVFSPENQVKNPPKVKVIKDDPEDDKFLSCAKKGDADMIVSNDSHLLNLEEFEGIPIMTSGEALNKL